MRSHIRRSIAALCASISLNASLEAAPVVTVKDHYVGGYWSLDQRVLDFYFTATPGAEFLNYRLRVDASNGAKILDPVKSATFDQDGDAVDTWMNTVYSLFGLGPPAQFFNSYRPTGIVTDSPPTQRIDWSVFDTGTGDTNSFDAGPPYGVVSAPWHIARIAVTDDISYTGIVTSFDSLTVDSMGNPAPTVFSTSGPPLTTQPAVSHSTIVATSGDSLFHLFKAIDHNFPPASNGTVAHLKNCRGGSYAFLSFSRRTDRGSCISL
jgi:hypothetical protein